MKERPILFSAPMVRAILEGRKTQTRRVVKPVGNDDGFVILDYGNGGWPYRSDDGDSTTHTVKRGGKLYLDETPHVCPYGQPGDRLWVRETWNWFDPDEIPEDRRGSRAPFTGCQGSRKIQWVAAYAADGYLEHAHLGRALWRPSIHMPRWASRILLEVTGVRVERLQDISEADALAEGIHKQQTTGWFSVAGLNGAGTTARAAYALLWNSINGPGSWDANPFVWVVEFKRLEGGSA